MTRHAEGDIYQWNYNNKLLSVEKGGVKTDYTYDFSGQRKTKLVQRSRSISSVIYVSKDFEVRDQRTHKYVFAAGRRIARISSQIKKKVFDQTQVLDLKKGWNLVSFKLEPKETRPQYLFRNIFDQLEAIYAYDRTEQKYLKFIPYGFSNLLELQAWQGYIIKVRESVSLKIEGSAAAQPVELGAGWNLSGFPIKWESGPAFAFNQIKDQLKSVRCLNSDTQNWHLIN